MNVLQSKNQQEIPTRYEPRWYRLSLKNLARRDERKAMPAIWYKAGVSRHPMNVECERCKQRVARLYASKGKDLMITSQNDSGHMMESRHYIDDAFDFRRLGVAISLIKKAAGPGFDVVLSNNGACHIEWDPK